MTICLRFPRGLVSILSSLDRTQQDRRRQTETSVEKHVGVVAEVHVQLMYERIEVLLARADPLAVDVDVVCLWR